jgi:hypothetical protein
MKRVLLILTILSYNICVGQYLAQATIYNKIKNRVLVDKSSGTKYILDSTQVYIVAFDSKGKLLWVTDPWKDNKLMPYRVKRPVIVYFYFEKNKKTNDKEVIWIVYNNTLFGVIDKQTGKFTCYGND